MAAPGDYLVEPRPVRGSQLGQLGPQQLPQQPFHVLLRLRRCHCSSPPSETPTEAGPGMSRRPVGDEPCQVGESRVVDECRLRQVHPVLLTYLLGQFGQLGGPKP